MGVERGRAYGLLLDNSWRTTVDIDSTHERELRFGAARGLLDHYVLHGPDLEKRARRCGWLTGLPPLPRPDVLPVFVRGGTIIPRQDVIQCTEEVPAGPPDCTFVRAPLPGALYLDDGTSFNYRIGGFLPCRFGCDPVADGPLVRADTEGAVPPWRHETAIILHDAGSATAQDGWQHEPDTRTTTIVVDGARLRSGVLWRR